MKRNVKIDIHTLKDRTTKLVLEIANLRTQQHELTSKFDAEIAQLDAKIVQLDNQLTLVLVAGPKPEKVNDATRKPGKRRKRNGVSEQIVAILRKTPGMPYSQMAEIIYGEVTTATRARLRTACSLLSTAGTIRSIGRARWEVVED